MTYLNVRFDYFSNYSLILLLQLIKLMYLRINVSCTILLCNKRYFCPWIWINLIHMYHNYFSNILVYSCYYYYYNSFFVKKTPIKIIITSLKVQKVASLKAALHRTARNLLCLLWFDIYRTFWHKYIIFCIWIKVFLVTQC